MSPDATQATLLRTQFPSLFLPFLPPTPGLGGTQESLWYPPYSWERDKESKGKQYKEVVKSLAWVQTLTATHSQYAEWVAYLSEPRSPHLEMET